MTEEIKQKSQVMLLVDKFCECRKKQIEALKTYIEYSKNIIPYLNDYNYLDYINYGNKLEAECDKLKLEEKELINEMKRYIDIAKKLIIRFGKVPPLELIPFCNDFTELMAISYTICAFDIKDIFNPEYDMNYYVISYTNIAYDRCFTYKTMKLILKYCRIRDVTYDNLIEFIKKHDLYNSACRIYIIHHRSIPPSTIMPVKASAELIQVAIDNLSEEDLHEFMKLVKQ